MGLGKTVQVISFIAHLVDQRVSGPYLIVAPLSTLPNWMAELKRFAPSLPAVLYHGTPEVRVVVVVVVSVVLHNIVVSYGLTSH